MSRWIFVALLVVAIAAATYHLARIIQRRPDAVLARRLRSYARAFAVLLPIAMTGDALRPATGLDSTFAHGVVLTMSGCGGLLAFAAVVGLMVAWWQARAVLRRCIAGAERATEQTD